MTNTIQRLYHAGQSIWCDNISRRMIDSGELQRLVEKGIVGVTSNPTIFMKAITGGTDYDRRLAELSAAHVDTMAIYEGLVLPDIADAADILRPVYDRTAGVDGYVSLEVNPKLAFDTEATVAEARRLFALLNRPNIFIKVPATDEGIPAIERLIGEGVNVNVTLIFSIAMYEKVMDAYLGGLRRFVDGGGDARTVSSVASFFVSRVDTLVDGLLDEKAASGVDIGDLRGKAAVANAQVAYARFREVFADDGPFAELQRRGARVQRPLWASTSTKDESYSDTKYCDELVAPDSVNTLPPATIDAVLDHGATDVAIFNGAGAAHQRFNELSALGIHMHDVTERLKQEGVAAFAKSFDELFTALTQRRSTRAGVPIA